MKKSLLVLLTLCISGLFLAGCSRQRGISVTAPADPTASIEPAQSDPLTAGTLELSSPSPLPTSTDLTSLENELGGLELEAETFE